MKKINLSVDDENLEVVLTILKNLKSGLISEIKHDNSLEIQPTKYQPKAKKVIYEEESGTNDRNGKYASRTVYKQRLKK